MLKLILIILIFIVIYKIYNTSTNKQNKSVEQYINITNPFVQGLSQAQLGNDRVDKVSFINQQNLPSSNSNVIIRDNRDDLNKSNLINRINKLSLHNNKNMMNDKIRMNDKSRINDNIELIKSLNKKTNKIRNNKNKINKSIPCKELNKFFIVSQFNDAYRDVLTAFFNICPDQKSYFNSQSLPVITTMYKMDVNTPFEFIKLTTQFINKLNAEINKLPDSCEIINTYNNYLPLTSQMNSYVKDKGINKFYKDIGVDYNLYADTPPNSPVELIKILKMTREYTEAETKYIITMVLKKILKSVSDQIQITIHFIAKNDPLEGYNLFDGTPNIQSINSSQNIAIEFIFVDGFHTNDFNVDYDCIDNDNNKKVSSIDGDDNYYSFDALGKNNLLSDNEIITEFNKKLRQHDLEMNNFNINVPYPVYNNKI